MYKHKLQVWGEDLAVADISKTSVTGEAVLAGGTNGGLVINVIAESAVTVASTVTVTVTEDDAKDGTFETTVATATLAAGTYAKGDCIAQIGIKPDVKMWLKGAVAGNSSASGTICVTLGLLAR